MKLIVNAYDVESIEPRAIIHDRDCVEIGVKEGERVQICGKRQYVMIANRSDSVVRMHIGPEGRHREDRCLRRG